MGHVKGGHVKGGHVEGGMLRGGVLRGGMLRGGMSRGGMLRGGVLPFLGCLSDFGALSCISSGSLPQVNPNPVPFATLSSNPQWNGKLRCAQTISPKVSSSVT